MSARPDTWMPLYVGDYLRDTGHLTVAEHGAYFLLLLNAWTRDGSLPDDDLRLRTMAKMDAKEWKASGSIIREFFYRADGCLRHKRMDRELENAKANSEAKAEAGRRGAEKRWRNDSRAMAQPSKTDGTGMAEPSPSHRQTDAPSPSPSPSPTEISSLRSDRALTSRDYNDLNEAVLSRVIVPVRQEAPRPPRSYDDDPDFCEFWRLYPRKDAKADAWKAWRAAVRKAAPSEIIEGLKRYRFSPDPDLQKMPAGWLRDERWLGQSTTQPVSVNGPPMSATRVDPHTGREVSQLSGALF